MKNISCVESGKRFSVTDVLLVALLWGLGCLTAVYIRQSFSYPRCPGDEENWVQIIRQLESGEFWPVSGPGFVDLARFVGAILGRSGENWPLVLAFMGVMGFGWNVTGAYIGYRMAGLSVADGLGGLWWLMTSSYWIGPALESRPQQWGMVLVLLTWLLFRRIQAVRKDVMLVFLTLYIVVFYVHIVSFVVMNALLAGEAYCRRIRGWPLHYEDIVWIVMCMVLTFWFFSPWSPYRSMVVDLFHFHLRSFPVVLVAFVGIGVTCVLWWGGSKVYPLWGRVIENAQRFLPLLCMGMVGAFSLGAVAQYWLAPPAYLTPYRGDLWRFFLVESGNMVFAFVFIWGWWLLMFRNQPSPLRVFAGGSTWLMGLGAVLLILSPWLGSKNAMIRVMNYWILVSAPVAWFGFCHFTPPVRWSLIVSWPLWLILSLFHVVKPLWLLGC